ncbi:MAG: DUF1622 domain-containing protein [Gloeomargarita sp. DG02_4_bins_56]
MYIGFCVLNISETSLFHPLEIKLGELAGIIKVILEFMAVVLILYGTVVTLQKFIRHCKRSNFAMLQPVLRLELGRHLGLALELLLAADIVSTAVSPSWDAIGRLAAISFIRTFLNYFLEQEVRQLEQTNGIEIEGTSIN